MSHLSITRSPTVSLPPRPAHSQCDPHSPLMSQSRGRKRKNLYDPSVDQLQSAEVHDDSMNEAKRTKMDKLFPLRKLLVTMEKDQLIDIICEFAERKPAVLQEMMQTIPQPSLQSVTQSLQTLEKKLMDSFPYTKWGPSKDDYSFNRVKPQLVELKDTIIEYCRLFTSPNEHPANGFAYLDFATSMAHRFPEWDNVIHNTIRHELYARLAAQWAVMIQHAADHANSGRIYGLQLVNEWVSNLNQHNAHSGGQFTRTLELFKQKLGWIIGMN